MKKKMSLSAELDLTQDSVVQLTNWCGQIALHELWGLGRTRLDRITNRQNLLGSQSLAVVMQPDKNGMPQTGKARQLREEALPAGVPVEFRVPALRTPRTRREQQLKIVGDRAATMAWQLMALACVQELGFGTDRLNRLYAEMRHNYEQLNEWGKADGIRLSSKVRFILSDTAGVNEEELADFSRDIVHAAGRMSDDAIRPLTVQTLAGNCISYRDARVAELKEISGNRDVSQGGTTSGLTAASAIAALQEAGSKLSRDMLKSAYRAFAKECYLILDASLLGQAERAAAEVDAEKAAAGNPPHQSAAQTASPQGEALSGAGSTELDAESRTGRQAAGSATEGSGIVDETAVNDDPAVHTAAQNASIEEYKNSVDPKMAEYVDKVRAGEKLEPYVVAKTSDRMRSAMMELTGLDKVGDYTLLDNNGVQHITNRHAGGDGSADATMKNSADVARAAYVLNNYDNAYLGTRKADGYYTSNRKKAPIVIFEKKIDGSHIIVEAVCDTKKSTNYIVSEYLSKNGVDEKEIAKRLQPSMDVASDPRDTSETLSAAHSATAEVLRSPVNAVADPGDNARNVVADPSAETSIAPGGASVNGNGVESGAETVESAADGMPSQSAQSGVDTVRTPHQSAAQTAVLPLSLTRHLPPAGGSLSSRGSLYGVGNLRNQRIPVVKVISKLLDNEEN